MGDQISSHIMDRRKARLENRKIKLDSGRQRPRPGAIVLICLLYGGISHAREGQSEFWACTLEGPSPLLPPMTYKLVKTVVQLNNRGHGSDQELKCIRIKGFFN